MQIQSDPKDSTPNEGTLEKFLLGELSENEQQAFEERLIADEDLFEHVRAVESDLIDAYARGELPRDRRQRFEERLAQRPELDERLRFARGLADVADQAPSPLPPAAPWWKSFLSLASPVARGALAAAAIVAAVAALGLWRQLGTVRSSVETERQAATSLEEALAQERTRILDLESALARERADSASEIARLEELARAGAEQVQPARREPVVVPFVLSVASLG